jgi:excisionase family DNA binding protein
MTPPLDVLIRAIAEQVVAKVKAEMASFHRSIEPILLSVKNAAIYLGRSEQSIQHLIFQHEIPVVRVGRRVHLDRRDLDAWIEKNKG